MRRLPVARIRRNVMPIRFTKMHGLGNDYVYVNTFVQTVPNAPELARRISDRHRGVGSDGLILIAPPGNADADVRMEMYNADGSRAQMCGNGIRCVAKYAYERGLACGNPLRVATDRGVLALELTLDVARRVERVRVDMGPPLLLPREIPVDLAHLPDPAPPNRPLVDAALQIADRRLRITAVSMGNPHAIGFVEGELAAVPLREWGPQIERHPAFPQRINVHFVRVCSRVHVQMVTWERGTGPTQACGTGASAVCVAGVLTGRAERRIRATLPGGELELEWPAADGPVFMTGPATDVFDGEWPDG